MSKVLVDSDDLEQTRTVSYIDSQGASVIYPRCSVHRLGARIYEGVEAKEKHEREKGSIACGGGKSVYFD